MQETSAHGGRPSIDPVVFFKLQLVMFFEEIRSERQLMRHAADWIAEQGKPQRDVHGLSRRTADFRISTTDPDARPMRLKGGGTHLRYHTHYVVVGGKARIILQALVTPSEVMDNQPMLDLLWRVRLRWKLHPRQVTGDTKCRIQC